MRGRRTRGRGGCGRRESWWGSIAASAVPIWVVFYFAHGQTTTLGIDLKINLVFTLGGAFLGYVAWKKRERRLQAEIETLRKEKLEMETKLDELQGRRGRKN